MCAHIAVGEPRHEFVHQVVMSFVCCTASVFIYFANGFVRQTAIMRAEPVMGTIVSVIVFTMVVISCLPSAVP